MSYGPAGTEIDALATRAENERQKLVNQVRRVARRLGWQDSYRRVFCDQSGALLPEAQRVLADLAKQANFGVIDVRASDADLRANEGARRMILHIFGRLDLGSDRLRKLSTTTRELKDE